MDEKVWIAVDVGCLECGESSSVVGIFKTEAECQAALDDARKMQEADWMGQHSFQPHEVVLPSWLTQIVEP